jgi:hypothetical protein
MLTDDKIKKLFLECEHNDPDSLYADEVDVLEFGRRIASEVETQARRAEREFCVQIVKSLNSEVAKVLSQQPEVINVSTINEK